MLGKRCLLHRLMQHMGKVQDIAFSARDEFLVTLGGIDDNAVVVWNAKSGRPVCGSPAGPDTALCCQWLNGREDRFVTAGAFHVRVWQVDFGLPKLHAIDVKTGMVRRTVTCMTLSNDDIFAYCGTETGDCLKVKIERDEIRSFNDPDTKVPSMEGLSKERFSLGILSIKTVLNPSSGKYNILVGAGDGTIAYLNPSLNAVAGKRATTLGGVSSICLHPGGTKFIIGTNQCNQYNVSYDLNDVVMVSSCHFGPVHAVTFPDGCSDLVISSSVGDVRIWNTKSTQELLRIQVPNLDCLCVIVTKSGSSIVTGWTDGKIRAFYPETGAQITFLSSIVRTKP